MSHPFLRSFVREVGMAMLFGIVVVAGMIVASRMTGKLSPDPILLAENSIRTSDPVADDSAGPVMTDSGLPDGESRNPPPLADKDR